jgi:hypothetical protein
MNTILVMSHNWSKSQEWLCWWGPAAIKCYAKKDSKEYVMWKRGEGGMEMNKGKDVKGVKKEKNVIFPIMLQ